MGGWVTENLVFEFPARKEICVPRNTIIYYSGTPKTSTTNDCSSIQVGLKLETSHNLSTILMHKFPLMGLLFLGVHLYHQWYLVSWDGPGCTPPRQAPPMIVLISDQLFSVLT